jgi:signal transduction histidine kinase
MKKKINNPPNRKTFKTLEVLSGSIAHEVRTPLAIININTENLHKELNHCFEKCAKHTPAMAAHKKSIEKFIKNIKFAVKSGSNIIDMLLIKLRSVVSKQTENQKTESLSIKTCINEVINEYPFYEDERKKVLWNDKNNTDFIYKGNNLLTKHVLFNLLKNSLRAIKENNHGEIYISLRSDKKFNYLIFKDTAVGIPATALKSLFQPFYSDSKDGTGLGLAFCKMIMQSYAGDITCDSKEGKYTEFSLHFPKLSV